MLTTLPTSVALSEALRALDRLLSSGYPGSPEKMNALREMATAANRMVRGMEQSAKDRELAESAR